MKEVHEVLAAIKQSHDRLQVAIEGSRQQTDVLHSSILPELASMRAQLNWLTTWAKKMGVATP